MNGDELAMLRLRVVLRIAAMDDSTDFYFSVLKALEVFHFERGGREAERQALQQTLIALELADQLEFVVADQLEFVDGLRRSCLRRRSCLTMSRFGVAARRRPSSVRSRIYSG